MTIIQFKT